MTNDIATTIDGDDAHNGALDRNDFDTQGSANKAGVDSHHNAAAQVGIATQDGATTRDDFDDLESMMRELSIYECVIMEIETKFRILSAQYAVGHDGNPIESISTRVKMPQSIREKLIKQGLPVTFQSMHENLHDIAGIRVICPFVDDLYALADLFLSQDDITLLTRKDYIANPKPNGYRSLHLIVESPVFTPHGKKLVKVEIQMRTIAMHFWANLEHVLNYKKDLDPELRADLAYELYSCAEASADLDERMGAVRRKVDACTTLLG